MCEPQLNEEKDDDDLVTIPRVEYEKLLHKAYFFDCLRVAGVDNWNGYSYAREMMKELED